MVRARWSRSSMSVLLLIRDADRLGRDGSTDETSQQEHGEKIGQRLDELHRHFADAWHADTLQTYGNGIEQADDQAGAERRERLPFAEDDGGQRDEALARRHVAAEA